MTTTKHQSQFDSFRRLHDGPSVLVLPNTWDAGSARLVEKAGAKAIATTSAGVAWSHGYPDGDALPFALLRATVQEIARVISVPLTVDIESGYSDDLASVEVTAAGVMEAGAVGINIEDGVGTPSLLCRKIERVKQAAVRLGTDVFVNARADVYLRALVEPEKALEETLVRARLYREAGADGLFVPAAIDREAIHTLAASQPLPLNILALPGVPAAAELQALGVRRLSAGSGLAQALWSHGESLVRTFLREGNSEIFYEEGRLYTTINALFHKETE